MNISRCIRWSERNHVNFHMVYPANARMSQQNDTVKMVRIIARTRKALANESKIILIEHGLGFCCSRACITNSNADSY